MLYAHMLPKREANKIKLIRMSHSEYVDLLKNDNAPVEPLETFRGSRIPIKHICDKDHISEMFPCNVVRKHYCKECSYEKTNPNILHYKDSKMYNEELLKKNITTKALEKYQGAFTKIMHECLICGSQYMAAPHNILRGREKCEKCKERQIEENFLKRVASVNPDIEVISPYLRKISSQKLNVRCRKCFYEWETFSNVLYVHRECQRCGKVSNTVDKEEFLKRLHRNNPYLLMLDDYNKSTDKYRFQCMKCNWIFEAFGSEMSYGKHSCPNCATVSKGEMMIKNILQKYKIDFIPQKTFHDCKSAKGYVMPFDFFIPSYNMLLEYQGVQHEKVIEYFGGIKQFEIQKQNDVAKKTYAMEHGFNFAEIWYKDYFRIEEILINLLKLDTAETAG